MSPPELGSSRFLLDQSAWSRSGHPRIGPLLSSAAASGTLFSCGPFVLEALYSARDAAELAAMHFELTEGMPYVETNGEAFALAHAAQLDLAGVTERFHRRPPIDYLIAATAHHHGLGVLHYDHDYDLIAEHSRLEFESRWVAEPGSL